MAKKILLIESDGAFAQELSAAIEARGLEARVVGDGQEALDLARVDRPDAIVLCVELPKLSGYSVCNKLKKDEHLKSIPLVITSAEATSDTFEQHRKLKTHAEAYLIKPFAPADLLRSIAALVPLPEETSDDEVVTLEDIEELESLGAAPLETAPEAPAAAAPEEDDDLKLLDEAFNSLAGDDATAITALDAVLTAGPAAVAPPPPPPPQHLAPNAPPTEPHGLGDEAEAALAALGADAEADAALAALAVESEVDLAEAAALLEDDPAATGEDLLRQAGIDVAPPAPAGSASREHGAASDGAAARLAALEDQLAAVQAALAAREASVAAAGEAQRAAEAELGAAATAVEASVERAEREGTARRLAEQRAAEAEARVAAAEAEVRTRTDEAEARVAVAEAEARTRTDEAEARVVEAVRRADEAETQVAAAVRRAEEAEAQVAAADRRADEAERQLAEVGREVVEAREEATRAGGEAAQARERAEALASELGRVQARAAEHETAAAALGPEVEQLRGQLEELRDAASGRAEVERALTEREKRIGDLEAQNAKHEERVVKAYQKLKNDEKLRDKARKALAIALQLLEERPGSPAPTDVPPRRE